MMKELIERNKNTQVNYFSTPTYGDLPEIISRKYYAIIYPDNLDAQDNLDKIKELEK